MRITEFTIQDKNGKVLCHSESATRHGSNSATKRIVRERFFRMLELAGMINGELVQCAVTGEWATKNTGIGYQSPNGIDIGHVIPDNENGPLCPCNLIPQLRSDNLTTCGHVEVIQFDPRVYWFATYAEFKPARIKNAVVRQAHNV